MPDLRGALVKERQREREREEQQGEEVEEAEYKSSISSNHPEAIHYIFSS